MFISLTRLRVRSLRFLPSFAIYTHRAVRQVKTAPGFLQGALLADKKWTFWTMTAWNSQEDMRHYMVTGPHKAAMPHLLNWCDEASVAHWTHSEQTLPSWEEADQRMRTTGRPSKVHHPSPHHAGLDYPHPRTTIGSPIRPA